MLLETEAGLRDLAAASRETAQRAEDFAREAAARLDGAVGGLSGLSERLARESEARESAGRDLLASQRRLDALEKDRDERAAALAREREKSAEGTRGILRKVDEANEGLRMLRLDWSSLRSNLQNVSEERPSPGARGQSPVSPVRADDSLRAGLYADFEEHFRGSEADIRARQAVDAARFRGVPGPVADLGCGRGEFLEALTAEGVAAIGCDSNAVMVSRAKEKKLSVDRADLFTWLAARADGSLGGITAFQVLEHLPPASLFDLVELAVRKLAPSGRVLFETINPESVYAMRWFWMDLTHVRPVPAPSLEQLLRVSGFRDVARGLSLSRAGVGGPASGSRRRPALRASAASPLRPAGLRRHGRQVGQAEERWRASSSAPRRCPSRLAAQSGTRRASCASSGATGHEAELVRLPFKWYPRAEILTSALAWRLLDVSEADGKRVDLVIPMKFPSYLVRHENKVVWLIHQFRQAYDRFGTTQSDFTASPEDTRWRELIAEADRTGLSGGAEDLHEREEHRRPPRAVQRNRRPRPSTIRRLSRAATARRRRRDSPSPRAASTRGSEWTSRSRAAASGKFRLVIAGDGADRARLEELARRSGADVRFTGRVSDEELLAPLRDLERRDLPAGRRGLRLHRPRGIPLEESPSSRARIRAARSSS